MLLQRIFVQKWLRSASFSHSFAFICYAALRVILQQRQRQQITIIGLRALALKAQYEAALGGDDAANKQSALLDQLKSLAGTGEAGPTAQLAAAQVCLAAGETAAAYQFVCSTNTNTTNTNTTPEMLACKIQIFLKLDRLDLATRELQHLQRVAGEESVLAELCAVYIYLATGSSMAADAEHSINSLAEQYGPSVYLLNLLAVALALQGDCVQAEAKLQECLRDFAEVQPQHETLANLVCVQTQQQQSKTQEAAAAVQQLLTTTTPSPCSVQFAANLERVTAAFDREAAKYKV